MGEFVDLEVDKGEIPREGVDSLHRSSKKSKSASGEKQERDSGKGGVSFKDAFMGARVSREEKEVDRENRCAEDVVVSKKGEWDSIELSPAFVERLHRRFSRAAIVKLLGRNIAPRVLEERLRLLWKPKGGMDFIDLGEGFMMIRCLCEEDFLKVFDEGPWMVFGHYLTVRKWEPDFDPTVAEIGSTAVWVRLPRLPFEYYDCQILEALGNCLGRTVKVDVHTKGGLKAKFARVCVIIDLSKPLKSKVWVRNKWQSVQYEGFGSICFTCGRMGHREPCIFQKVGDGGVDSMKMDGCSETADGESKKAESVPDGYGPWLMAEARQYRGRQRNGNVKRFNGSFEGPRSGSRFESLEEDDGGIVLLKKEKPSVGKPSVGKPNYVTVDKNVIGPIFGPPYKNKGVQNINDGPNSGAGNSNAVFGQKEPVVHVVVMDKLASSSNQTVSFGGPFGGPFDINVPRDGRNKELVIFKSPGNSSTPHPRGRGTKFPAMAGKRRPLSEISNDSRVKFRERKKGSNLEGDQEMEREEEQNAKLGVPDLEMKAAGELAPH